MNNTDSKMSVTQIAQSIIRAYRQSKTRGISTVIKPNAWAKQLLPNHDSVYKKMPKIKIDDVKMLEKYDDYMMRREELHKEASARVTNNFNKKNKALSELLKHEFTIVFNRFSNYHKKRTGDHPNYIPIKLDIYDADNVDESVDWFKGETTSVTGRPSSTKIINVPRHICFSDRYDIYQYIKNAGYNVINDELNNMFLGDEMISFVVCEHDYEEADETPW